MGNICMPCRGVRIPTNQVRAYWAERQGLSNPAGRSVAEVLRGSGWIYSAGSTLPYLALRARNRGCKRSEIDHAVFEEESVVEAPSVRGCTMLVPREDLALAITAGQPCLQRYLEKVRLASNITEREIRELCVAIPDLMRDGILSMDNLRERLPASLVRNLGPEGQKLGERSTLTYVMRVLQRQMVVQRIAADRRLDSESYRYRLLPQKLRDDLTQDEAETGLGLRFFSWASPATVKEFAWWAGITQRKARMIMDKIGLVQISVEGWAKEAWIPAHQLDALNAARDTRVEMNLVFLPFRDNYLYFRRGIKVFLDDVDQGTTILDWRNQSAVLADMDSLHHNAIIEGTRLAGYWEYDPSSETVVWRTCSRLGGSRQRKLESGIAELRDFIRSQLGDVAFYSFDGGKNRRQRIDSLRQP